VRKSGFLMILFLSPLVFTIPIAHCNESDEVQEWIAELKDEDPRIRQTAAEILGRLKDPRAIGPLIVALVDEDPEVQEAVFEALKSFPGWGKSDEANRVVPELIVVLQDQRKDPEVRKNAAEALGKIKDPRAVEPLIEALKDKDFRVRWNAAEALGEIGDPKAVKPLIAALKDKDSTVRLYAAEALGKIKDPRAVEPLITALKDEYSEVRWHAAWSLGEIQDPRAVEPLIEALKDEDSGVRLSAAWSLEKITKEHFGREVAKWEEWLKKQKAGE